MERKEREFLLQKIRDWQSKTRNGNDPFDKYISLFIAYNIFYNMYKRTKEPSADLTHGDRNRATMLVLELLDKNQLIQLLNSDLQKYVRIIPVKDEEWWSNGNNKSIPISKTLKESLVKGDIGKTIEMLLKWLYMVRCNLVHGGKDYDLNSQGKLLDSSSSILDKILTHLVERYQERYK